MRVASNWRTYNRRRPLCFVFRLTEDPSFYVAFLLTEQGCRVYEGAKDSMPHRTQIRATIDQIPGSENTVIMTTQRGEHLDMTVEPANYTRPHAWTLHAARRFNTFMKLVDPSKYTVEINGNNMSLKVK